MPTFLSTHAALPLCCRLLTTSPPLLSGIGDVAGKRNPFHVLLELYLKTPSSVLLTSALDLLSCHPTRCVFVCNECYPRVTRARHLQNVRLTRLYFFGRFDPVFALDTLPPSLTLAQLEKFLLQVCVCVCV